MIGDLDTRPCEPADVARILRAGANPDRLVILRVLLDEGRSMTISEVTATTDLDRFAASRHLSVLRDAGLVEGTSRGARTLHRLRRETFETLEDWLIPFTDDSEPVRPAGASARGRSEL